MANVEDLAVQFHALTGPAAYRDQRSQKDAVKMEKTNPWELSSDEQNLLAPYLEAFKDLASGRRKPSTDAQRRFVRVCRGLEAAESPYEIAFYKFVMRRRWEKEEKQFIEQMDPETMAQRERTRKAQEELQRFRAENHNREMKVENTKPTNNFNKLVDYDIPEHEDGYPRAGWSDEEDWKRMKSGEFADMKRRSRGD